MSMLALRPETQEFQKHPPPVPNPDCKACNLIRDINRDLRGCLSRVPALLIECRGLSWHPRARITSLGDNDLSTLMTDLRLGLLKEYGHDRRREERGRR